MKTSQPKFFQPAALLTALGLLALVSQTYCATITWTNSSGGNWSVAANWSPNQVPANTNDVLITTPGTYTVTLDLDPNFFNTVTNAANLTLGAGGGAAGVQTFLVTNLTYSEFLVGSLLQVTNGGVLTMTNDFSGLLIANPLLIDKGGVFNGQGENLPGPLVIANGGVVNSLNGKLTSNSSQGGATTSLLVTNGGVLNANGDTLAGPTTVANGGVLNAMNVGVSVALMVAPGGVLNVLDYPSESLGLYGPLTNSGTINVSNGGIGMINSIYGGTGGLVNQTGGLINLQGSTAIGGDGYFVNQGVIVQSAGTNSLGAPMFDNRQGTITNLSGILTLELIRTNLTGTYFADAGATIQFQGADIANANSAAQLTLGTPLVLAGGGQYQLTSGYLYLPANVPPNLELMGDTLQLGPGFQGGTITNLTLDGIQLLNAVPITGSLAATNSAISTNLTVATGGVLSASGSAFLGEAITIAHAGTMNVEGPVILISSLTNAGTLNLTSPITFGGTFGGGTYEGVNNGIVNQAGGLINLGNNAGIIIPYPFSPTTNYFINQGAIVQNAGIGATNTINVSASVFDFDNSQGAITNLSGTLILTFLQGPLTGTFYAAAGATIQLGGGTAATPLQPGVLGGSGQLQFISGYLYAPANVPPNLSLQGGLLELGPGFQGGAITNLTLDGMELTNQLSTTLPIKGKFTVLNSGGNLLLKTGVYGNYVVVNGGFLSLSNAAMYGAVTVSSGGVLNGSGTIYGAVTVANGGTLNPYSTFNLSAPLNNSGTINLTNSQFSSDAPLNNSGTINLTNSQIEMYNDGTTNFTGSLINQAGGLIEFLGNGVIGGSGGYDYVANQGQIIDDSAGSGYTVLATDNATNSGTITVQKGQLFLAGPWTLLPGGSLNVVLNSATNYGNIFFASHGGPVGASAVLAGSFNATLNNNYVPTNGTTFNVLTYGSFTGSFSSLGLPAAVTWQSNYGSTNFSLLTESELPQFGIVNLSGTNLIFSGTGGTAGSNYVMLASTNLALPLTNWTALTTNTFDGSGQFHYTNHVSPAKPRPFFIFKLP
jgi:hypothetical protein